MSQSFFSILADAAPAATAAAAPFNPSPIIYMVCLGAIFYFMVFRPQSQRAKDQEAIVKGVKTGDKVITAAGIHGMVANVKETTVILKIADNVKIELEKSSIGTVVKRTEAEPAATAS